MSSLIDDYCCTDCGHPTTLAVCPREHPHLAARDLPPRETLRCRVVGERTQAMEIDRALKSTVHHRKSPRRVQRAREMAAGGETLRSIVVETSLTDTAVARIMAEVDGQPLPAEARLIYERLQQRCATVSQLAVVIGAAPPGMLARSADCALVRAHVHMLRRRLRGRAVELVGDDRGSRRYRLT